MRALLLIPFLLLVVPQAAGAAPGSWSLLAVTSSGDWGGAGETDRQATMLRYRWGRALRLRADLEYVRLRTAGDLVALTPFGPVATGPGPRGGKGGAAADGGAGPGPGVQPGAPPGGADDVGPADLTTAEPVAVDRGWNGGLGDLRLGLSAPLVGGGDRAARVEVSLGVKVPLADEEEYLGTGEWDYRLGAAAEYELLTGRLFGGIGWNRLGDPAWVELEDVLDAYGGYESDPLAGGLVVGGWLEANQEVVAGAGERLVMGIGLRGRRGVAWRAELTAGLSGPAEDLSLSFGVGPFGGSDAGSPACGPYCHR